MHQDRWQEALFMLLVALLIVLLTGTVPTG